MAQKAEKQKKPNFFKKIGRFWRETIGELTKSRLAFCQRGLGTDQGCAPGNRRDVCAVRLDGLWFFKTHWLIGSSINLG